MRRRTFIAGLGGAAVLEGHSLVRDLVIGPRSCLLNVAPLGHSFLMSEESKLGGANVQGFVCIVRHRAVCVLRDSWDGRF
jgi:hypothetical protein